MVVEQIKRTQMAELIAKGKRLDGRSLLDYRQIKIEKGVIEKAEGSARVSIGNTQVIAGVKVDVGTPFPDTPDQGLLVVNAEVLPLASPYAEPGPPSEETIELARVVDRGVRGSKMIDLSSLVLVESKKVYTVFVDVSVLNVDGNLFDTTSYAVVSSLAAAKMPVYNVKDESVTKTEEFKPIPISTLPISVTLARIGDALLVDPTSEEEAVMDSRLTLVTNDKERVVAGQKGCSGTLNFEQVAKGVEISRLKGKEIREEIRRQLGL